MNTTGRRRPPGEDVLSVYTIFALGVPDGMIGTAWPAMRRSFGAPLEDIGLVLLAGSIGAVATSAVAGVVVGRIGVRTTIMVAACTALTGAFTAILAPVFPALVVAGLLIGLAAGFLDSAVNTAVALAGRNRLLNLVHGFYGVGTAVGPLVVTGAIVFAGTWRPAYAVLVAAELALLAGWWWSGRRRAAPVGNLPVSGPVAASGASGIVPGSAPPQGLRMAGTIALGLFVFLVYTGMEVAAGQWEPSYDRSHLHMGAGATGVAVFGYWAALTAVRLGLAVPSRAPSRPAIVRWGCLLALAGAALVWWAPGGTVAGLFGFAAVGAGLAGVFPALVALTPGRVGDETAKHVIGWQIGAASIGGSAISAAFGVVFQHAGLGWLGPCLVVVGCVLFCGSEALRRLAPGPVEPRTVRGASA